MRKLLQDLEESKGDKGVSKHIKIIDKGDTDLGLVVKEKKGKYTYVCKENLKWSGMKSSSYIGEYELRIVNGSKQYPENLTGATYDFETKEEDLKKVYDQYISALARVNEKFGMKLNMWSPALIAQEIAYNTFKYVTNSHAITEKECEYLSGCLRGALIYAEKDKELETGYDYDINSFYPSILNSYDFLIPLQQGQLKDYDDMTNYDEKTLDICKCRVKSEHKWFKQTPDDYYDTYHRKIMDLLGIKYRISRTEKKLVFYNCVPSGLLLGDVMGDLYELKQKEKNVLAKPIINAIWGVLVKRTKYRKTLEELTEYDFVEEFDLVKGIAYINNKGKEFSYNTGRMKPFLLSYGRYLLTQKLLSLEKEGYEIYKVDTDGWICNKKPEDETLSDGIGCLKFVKTYENIKIKHARNILDLKK